MTRIGFDTLAYIGGVDRNVDGGPKIEASRALLKRLSGREGYGRCRSVRTVA